MQSDPTLLTVHQRAALIGRAAEAGLRRIEAVSFVNPAQVPQMAGSTELMAVLNDRSSCAWRDDVSLIGLVLNGRGLQQAVECGVDEINVVVVCTDTFAERNQGRTTDGLIDVWRQVAGPAGDAGLRTTVTVSAAFGCPYEGEVATQRVADVVARIVDAAVPDELALADSVGAAGPVEVRERLDAASLAAPGVALRCHFHNTRNTGMANVVAAVEWGVAAVDSSLGGIGGCPFAPKATGNVPTEDVAYLLHRMGVHTGTDLTVLAEVGPWLEELLGHPVPGLLSKAGLFG